MEERMKIYTKTGDRGETGLFAGPRVFKDDPRIEAYGTVDELNSILGVVRSLPLPAELNDVLSRIQNDLFSIGAELATPEPEQQGTDLISVEDVERLEAVIDRCEQGLRPLKQFILPAGTATAAQLHLARAVCRRAERRLISFWKATKQPVSDPLMAYLNRLGDLLFVLARFVNHAADCEDVPWQR